MKSRLDWPKFNAKAGNTVRMIEFLLHISREDTQHARVRKMTIWAAVEILHALKSWAKCGMFLSSRQARRIEFLRSTFFNGYTKLSTEAAQSGHARYGMVPKFHYLDHILRDAATVRLNPVTHWTFAEEDMMGKMAKMAVKSHALTLPRSTLQRWILQFFGDR